jgi:hypothetical protein
MIIRYWEQESRAMGQRDSYAEDVKQHVKQATSQAVAHPWFAYLARFGYAAKGVVYLIAGSLSARAAFGLGGRMADKSEALRAVLRGPLGQVMLVLIAVGLIGFVLLRFVQAFLDSERKGSDAKGMAIRGAYLISALVYAGLALSALRLAIGADDGQGDILQRWAAWVFGLPFGRWLIGAAGLVLIGFGLWQLYQAYSVEFSEHLRWGEMNATERTWTRHLGRVGLVARGIVFGLIGGFAVQAALAFDAGKVRETRDALQALAEPLGPWAVGVVAAGLAAYGLYMLVVAWYGRIVTR